MKHFFFMLTTWWFDKTILTNHPIVTPIALFWYILVVRHHQITQILSPLGLQSYLICACAFICFCVIVSAIYASTVKKTVIRVAQVDWSRTGDTQGHSTVEALLDNPFLLDQAGIILGYMLSSDSPSLCSFTPGKHIAEVFEQEQVGRQFIEALQKANDTHTIQTFEYRLLTDKAVIINEAQLIPIENEYLCIVCDITKRTLAEEALRISEECLHAAVSQSPVVLYATDANGVVLASQQGIWPNANGKSRLIVGHSAFELYRDIPPFSNALQRALAGETVSQTIDDYHDRVIKTQNTPRLDPEGNVIGMIGLVTDITRRVRAEDALRHQTLHDPLTNLPNRTLLLDHITDALAKTEQGEDGIALLVLDLDRFKEINDTFGHQCGDQLLQQVGSRLLQAINPAASVHRLGGDEFAILLPSTCEIRPQTFVKALNAIFEEPFLVERYPLHVEVSIGIALSPAHGDDPLTLLRHAEVAMYTAKGGRKVFAFYDTDKDQYSPHRLALLADLRKAIATDELCLFFQPKAQLETGQVKSVEALVRWQHPTYGFLSPDQFLPLAEQTGLIEPLTHWVLETAIAQCRRWLDMGITLGVAVNLSTWNLRNPKLPDMLNTLLEKHGVPAHLLYMEITESAVMTDVEQSIQILERIRESGIRIAVDDYGTGYSSLSYLKQLPVDELKIDRAFVQHLAANNTDQAIVQSTVTLAHHLGMSVVAEGVEDLATWDLLTTMGCDIIQGYYLSRPVPAQELEKWLATRKELVAS
jgi:diguanylate cyclase (GGDEF)-like protein